MNSATVNRPAVNRRRKGLSGSRMKDHKLSYSTPHIYQSGAEDDLSRCALQTDNSFSYNKAVESGGKDADIANWVEHTTRFSVSSSCTDISSGSDYNHNASEGVQSSLLRLDELRLLQKVYNTFRTENWVARSMVNLYTSARYQPWKLEFTGVPVLLLDHGGSRSRNRGVRFVLAERETGLTLWYDKLDNLSSYTSETDPPVFHTFHCSPDHSKRVGLSWDRSDDAGQFLNQVNLVLSSPENIGLSGPKLKPKHRTSSSNSATSASSKAWSRLSKTDISRPIGFTHNVSLTIDNLAGAFQKTAIA